MLPAIGFVVKYGSVVLRFGPVLVGVVRAVEQIRGGTLPGAQKKRIALEVVEKAIQVFGYTLTPTVKTLIDHAIEVVVAGLSLKGELQGKGTEAVIAEVKEKEVKKEVLSVAGQVIKNRQQLEDLKMLMSK
jgi:hypothetical protein